MDPHQTATHLLTLLRDKGTSDYIGEPITQLAHSLQCAHLATENHADDETILAALFHDIGQFLPADQVRELALEVRDMSSKEGSEDDSVGRVGHEAIGETYLLRLGFSERVASLVGSHVAAKRFLCAVEPEYYDTLSDASKKSLRFQGGPMKGSELETWRVKEICGDMCRLRKWDDEAKVVGLEVDGVDAYEAMIVRHLEGRVSC